MPLRDDSFSCCAEYSHFRSNHYCFGHNEFGREGVGHVSGLLEMEELSIRYIECSWADQGNRTTGEHYSKS